MKGSCTAGLPGSNACRKLASSCAKLGLRQILDLPGARTMSTGSWVVPVTTRSLENQKKCCYIWCFRTRCSSRRPSSGASSPYLIYARRDQLSAKARQAGNRHPDCLWNVLLLCWCFLMNRINARAEIWSILCWSRLEY